MNVHELIEVLKTMPQNDPVYLEWDREEGEAVVADHVAGVDWWRVPRGVQITGRLASTNPVP